MEGAEAPDPVRVAAPAGVGRVPDSAGHRHHQVHRQEGSHGGAEQDGGRTDRRGGGRSQRSV